LANIFKPESVEVSVNASKPPCCTDFPAIPARKNKHYSKLKKEQEPYSIVDKFLLLGYITK
jgi:hypothetical protein